MILYRCPECKSSRLRVVVKKWADLIQNYNPGDENFETDTCRVDSDEEWDHDSLMECTDCYNRDPSSHFQLREE